MKRLRRPVRRDAELDITSFLNLMIVLVPVLLLNMVFSHISVLDIQLPQQSDVAAEQQENKILELVIRDDGMSLNYPAGQPLKAFPLIRDGGTGYDFAQLADYLKELKRTFQQKGIDKREILLLSEPNTDYQTLVTTMDTVRSFKAVVAADLVDAELFPVISLGDAPEKTAIASASDLAGGPR
jgi:biopolymer transport protein ExbD